MYNVSAYMDVNRHRFDFLIQLRRYGIILFFENYINNFFKLYCTSFFRKVLRLI
jgi:hypothetical protein